MSYMTFNFSSATGKVDKSGKFMMNGFNSHILAPVGAIAPFQDRFAEAFDGAIIEYPTTIDVNNQVNDLQNTLLSSITNLEEDKLSTADFSDELGNASNADVIESYGTFTTNAQLGQYYGLTLNSTTDGNTFLTGFEVGQLTNTSGNNTTNDSFFRIAADKFIIGKSVPTNGGVDSTFATSTDAFDEYVPAFTVDSQDNGGYNITFNGTAIFQNLVGEDGETIIDGEHITTGLINADEVITGAGFGNTNFGYYLSEPTAQEIDDATGNLDPSYVLKTGDKYYDDNYEYEYHAVLGTWVSSIEFTEDEASAAIATSRDNVATGMGFASYGNMVSEYSSLGTTLISGGYIRSGVIESDVLVGKKILIDDTNPIFTASNGYSTASEFRTSVADFAIFARNTDSNNPGSFAQTGIGAAGVRYGGIFEGDIAVRATGVSYGVTGTASSGTGYGLYGLGGKGAAWLNGKVDVDGNIDAVGHNISCDSLSLNGSTPTNSIAYFNNTGNGVGCSGYTADPTQEWGLYTTDKLYTSAGVYPFTGAHIGFGVENHTLGDIVEVSLAQGMSVSQSYVEVLTTTVPNSKKVYGVVESVKDDMAEWMLTEEHYNTKIIPNITREVRTVGEDEKVTVTTEEIPDYQNPIYTPKEEYREYIEKTIAEGYLRVSMNAVGEGMINVCEISGDIENGDYITSSIVPGKGMKQDDDLLHNYTVAKSLQDVVWADWVVGDKCYLTEGSDGVMYKTMMIACTYHCG